MNYAGEAVYLHPLVPTIENTNLRVCSQAKNKEEDGRSMIKSKLHNPSTHPLVNEQFHYMKEGGTFSTIPGTPRQYLDLI